MVVNGLGNQCILLFLCHLSETLKQTANLLPQCLQHMISQAFVWFTHEFADMLHMMCFYHRKPPGHSHTNPSWLYWLCGWSWSCVLLNRRLKTVLIHLSGKKDICLYCQTERLHSQENADKKPAFAENMTYNFQIVFETLWCTTVPCLTTSLFRGKSIGMNVSAVIIYIHSLTYHCDSRMTICTKPVAAGCLFNRNTSVCICTPVPSFFPANKHDLLTKTVKCP